MASQDRPARPSTSTQHQSTYDATASAQGRPTDTLIDLQTNTESVLSVQSSQPGAKKRKGHRAGKKTRRNRRQSFLPATDENEVARAGQDRPAEPPMEAANRPPLYRLARSGGRNLSETSLDSEALLDHRDHQPMRPRRESRTGPTPYSRRSNHDSIPHYRPPRRDSYEHRRRRQVTNHETESSGDDSDDGPAPTDRTPLMGATHPSNGSPAQPSSYGGFARHNRGRRGSENRHHSAASSVSSKRKGLNSRQASSSMLHTIHDVNNPPSMPNSPKIGPDIGYDDVITTDPYHARPSDGRRTLGNDQVIDIDNDADEHNFPHSTPPTPPQNFADQRRHTIALPAEEDVCFPVEGMSALGEEEYLHQEEGARTPQQSRRRRYRQWPDLSVFEEWSREEKEQRSEGIRTKKISEPVLVGGRLRPQQRVWHKTEEDAPYRFTYFNEDFPSTIHSHTVSELLQPGQDFKELFIPDPPELSDDDYSSEEDFRSQQGASSERPSSLNGRSKTGTRHSSLIGDLKPQSPARSEEAPPAQSRGPPPIEKPKRYGERPTFWLDVLSPTDTEMRVISKAFGIHPLTAEDIMMQEAREKVELFPKYYFVNYRTFEQDVNSDNHLEAVNMYVVVFPEGVISFHFSMTPHPANVRRRIRQLKEYLQVSSDWISYALVDDITDVFVPLIQSIEDEVDEIDDAILKLLYDKKDDVDNEKAKAQEESDREVGKGAG
ncbi:uncharacterized protein KY384_002556 [Bacidia gigantensis]|uniref:uncharacterized protein n=1 Tax=Bacidia gigantensis TaxID=2732470 RepID=UPI001D044670|nr:uncharacterized protein KY384_002556 [Bacidia gigantensis]KAG8532679.1 hypothetical protein KY384_002556 [Bacidia gigantensis]